MMLNKELIAAREKKGWTQAYLAEKLGVTPVTISRWENGFQAPRAYFVSRLCHTFGMSAADLGLSSHQDEIGRNDGERAEQDLSDKRDTMYIKRREILALLGMAGAALILPLADVDWEAIEGAVEKPAQMSMQVVDDLWKITDRHWRVVQASTSKAAALDGVLGEIKVLTNLLNDSHPPSLHKPLCMIASDLGQLAGEIFFDLNDYTTARSCYAFAASTAKEADNYDLWSCALIRHSYLFLYEKDFQTALLLLRGAEKAASRSDSQLVTRYWAAAVRAEAHAGMGNLSACQCALDLAEEVRLKRNGMNGTWLRFDSSRLSELRGACLVRLEQPILAIPTLQKALVQLPPSGRRRGMVLADLASASLQQKKVHQACGYLSQVIDLALQGSGMLRKSVQTLRIQLEPFSHASSVIKLNRQLTQLGEMYAGF